MKFHIKTFGCRTNIAESEELSQKLQKYFTAAKTPKEADFIIVRSCAVTAGAEQGVRQAIRNYKRDGKTAYILGCFMEKLPEAKYFKNDMELLKFIKKSWDSSAALLPQNDNKSGRIRAFIKIQSGCDFKCAFCVTRVLRGKPKDEKEIKILQQIREAEKDGAKEIVLTGTNILLYKNLPSLIKKILSKTKIQRLRFGSIDPRLMTPTFIKLFRNPRLMPHLHLSLQSGSEKILAAMSRPMKIAKIKTIASTLRRINPLFNISADIIVGFPGETEADFETTLALAKNLKLSRIHYFSYSPRPKTPAENFKPVKNAIVSERLKKIKRLGAALQTLAKQAIIRKPLTILFECGKNRVYCGYTPNFMRIKYNSQKNLTGILKQIIIKKNNYMPR